MIGEVINIDAIIKSVYDVETYPYEQLANATTTKGIYDIFGTFDIETTTFTKKKKVKERGKLITKTVGDFSFMYVWQFCLNGDIIMGHTWEEFQTLLLNIANQLNENHKFVIYVHNLAYEFQFFRRFLPIDKLFARSERNVVYCLSGMFEFRCSYVLTNKSLAKFLSTTRGVTIQKQDGEEFDYSVKRYPDTTLSDKETWYCICDVLGLWQAINVLLQEDTLASIPMTSTGYVRRDFANACLADPNYKKMLRKLELDSETYLMCKRVARGAISGSNAYYTNEILFNVDSYDIKSSYPYQMITQYFPMSKFVKVHDKSNFKWFIDNKCCMIDITFYNIELKFWNVIPYISRHKCVHEEECKWGNGKVYRAKELTLSVTEIDFKIIATMYKFDFFSIHTMYVADRGLLPKVFRETLIEYFQQKEELGLLKDDDENVEYEYNKFKNKINSSFGMMLTDIINDLITYFDDWDTEKITDIDGALKKYYRRRKTFLTYQWGVWVLAHGRESLYRGMEIVKDDVIQTDTDSLKFINDHTEEFKLINEQIMNEAENFDVKPYAIVNGNKVYLGIWEHEKNKLDKNNPRTYSQFKTLGAKKYCYADSNGMNVKITVAGLQKKAGEYFDKNGGISYFKIGTVVPPKISGRCSAYYDDTHEIITREIDGHVVTYSSNMCLVETDYTFGVTDEWLEMINPDI